MDHRFSLSGDNGNDSDIWGLRLIRVALLRERGHVEEALSYLTEREISCLPAPDDIPSIARIKSNRGYCYGLLGKFDCSHFLMSEAEHLLQDASLMEIRCEVYERQAIIFYFQRDYDSSDRIFRRMLNLSELLDGWYFKATALWGIGKNLMIRQFYSEAMPWLEQSLTLFESVNARLSMACAWADMAVCHLGLGDDEKALALHRKALEEDSRAGMRHNYQVHLANIGNVYLYRTDYLRAISYYRQAITIAEEIKDPVSVRKWTINIRLAYHLLKESVNKLDNSLLTASR